MKNLTDYQSTNDPNEFFKEYSDELLNFGAITCIVFVIIGIPGNILTIIALLRGKQNRNSTAVFIINLSVSDLLFCCFNLPLAASTFLRRGWTHSFLMCRLFPLLRYGLLAVSLFTVSLITINRYVIIAHPRHYTRIYQHRYLALMIIGTWLLCFSIMIPTWRGIWGEFGWDASIGSCSILSDTYGRSPKEFLFVLAFMVPCCCICFCYARIFYLVRKAAKRSREPATKQPNTPPIKLNGQKIVEKARGELKKEENSNNSAASGGGGGGGMALTVPLQEPIVGDLSIKPFAVNEELEFIDASLENIAKASQSGSAEKSCGAVENQTKDHQAATAETTNANKPPKKDIPAGNRQNPIKTSIKTSFTRFTPRKSHYVSMGNTSNASAIYPGRMSVKDRRLLKMILVIFISFVICYLPITITKIYKEATNSHLFNIMSYLLVYVTTCINPIIYVLMSSEYRQAYWNLLRCHCDTFPSPNTSHQKDFNRAPKT